MLYVLSIDNYLSQKKLRLLLAFSLLIGEIF
jgi:hypothetical protein